MSLSQDLRIFHYQKMSLTVIYNKLFELQENFVN